MGTMQWLKKFNVKHKIGQEESSGFNPLHLNVQDNIKDKKTNVKYNPKGSFKDIDFGILEVRKLFLMGIERERGMKYP